MSYEEKLAKEQARVAAERAIEEELRDLRHLVTDMAIGIRMWKPVLWNRIKLRSQLLKRSGALKHGEATK